MTEMKLTGKFSKKTRLKTFLGSYQLRVVFPNKSIGYVGRGSVGLLGHFCYFSGAVPNHPLIEIGNFCESAETRIILDGDHSNNKIFNNSLGSFPMIREVLRRNNNEAWRPFSKDTIKIGNAVILSIDSTVLSGADIGDGTLVGAGSVVKTKLSEYCIAVGNPCKNLKPRLSENQINIAKEIQWWNLDIEYFINHSALLMDLENNYNYIKTSAVYDKRNIRVVIDFIKSPEFSAPLTVKVIGIDMNEKYYAIEKLPEVNKYFNQMYRQENQELTWVPCIFKYLNIY